MTGARPTASPRPITQDPTPTEGSVADRETRDRVSLMLRRAGFGANPADLERYVGLGVEGTLDELLHPDRIEEDFDGLLSSLSGHLIDLQNIEDVQTWWLYRMARTRRPLVE